MERLFDEMPDVAVRMALCELGCQAWVDEFLQRNA